MSRVYTYILYYNTNRNQLLLLLSPFLRISATLPNNNNNNFELLRSHSALRSLDWNLSDRFLGIYLGFRFNLKVEVTLEIVLTREL